MKIKRNFILTRSRRLLWRLSAVIFLSAAVASGSDFCCLAATSAVAPSAYDQDDTDKIEVNVKNGYIYVNSSRKLTLQLYSILGQLVTQQVIQPGVTRIKAPAKGVYILKAGSVTRRVTVN